MVPWTDDARAETARYFQAAMSETEAIFARARAMIGDPASADVGLLLHAFIAGVGSHVDVALFRLRQLTDEVGHVSGQLDDGDSFFGHDWNVRPEVLQRYRPECVEQLFPARSNEGVDAAEILEWCPNECLDLAWPTSLAGYSRRPRRLPFRAYSTSDASAYVEPYRYQVFSRDLDAMWSTASPRCLSRQFMTKVIATEIDKLHRNIVIIQDRFGFGNFCHFLFDGVTRVLHYVSHFGYTDELFVMAGIPGPYQQLVCRALAEVARIPENSLFFPDRPYLFRSPRKCVWFSDQKELHVHPAQMAHPQSLAALRPVAEKVPGTDSSATRVYVSRGDADRRRVNNEAELTRALEARGFISVQLAKISVEEQVGLFRNAEVVVAPHGMGLTHIAMGNRLGRVIELFHPEAGTDAYAFVARSAGFHYDHLLGEPIPGTPSDFAVDVGRVLDLLGPDVTSLRRPNWHKRANLIPASRTFGRFDGGMTEPPDGWAVLDFAPMMADQAVRFHRKAGPAANTLVGQWASIDIAPRTLYVASCWVWLPERFPVNELSIRIAGAKPEHIQAANLTTTMAWQKISCAAITSADATRCAVGLHVIGHEGTCFASTCWQLERGRVPGAYLATG